MMRAKNLGNMMGCLILVVFSLAAQAQANRDDVLVVPARARMVRLAFDLQALRGLTLVSYRLTDDPLQPLLHVWSPARRAWQEVPAEALSLAPAMPAVPQRVYVIGRNTEVPEVIPAALSQARELRTLDTLSVAQILTTLDREMQFSIEEWKALAERHNLEITEVNREQRRWGRFGPPRRYREANPPTQQQPTAEDRTAISTDYSTHHATGDVVAPEATPPREPVAADPPPAPAVPQPEPETDETPEAVFDYLLEYEPAPLDPVPPPTTEETMPEPEKGLPQQMAEEIPASNAGDQDFPIK